MDVVAATCRVSNQLYDAHVAISDAYRKVLDLAETIREDYPDKSHELCSIWELSGRMFNTVKSVKDAADAASQVYVDFCSLTELP